MLLRVSGKVFSGMGKGRYYVGHPEYQRRFEEKLGYRPFPGTLNIKLDEDGGADGLRTLRTGTGVKIPGFEVGGESFSSLVCFDGRLGGERVTLLFVDVTYYNETVAELISPAYLRGKLGLKDGDEVTFEVDSPEGHPR